MQKYEIVVRGHVDKRRADWFQGLDITQLPEGNTLLAGNVMDQASLHSILNRIRDMGLQLLSVERRERMDE